MEEGSLRCDGNVSLRRRGSRELGTKTELKNMNSFKNLHDGLVYEICRQAEVLEDGGSVRQETRHWEPANKCTITMRVKETADDYRLFPEPDLAPYDLSDEFIDSVRAKLPELPDAKKLRYTEQNGLPAADAATIAADPELSAFFDAAMAGAADGVQLARPVANLLLNEVSAYLNNNGLSLSAAAIAPAGLLQLAQLVASGDISSKQAKEVFAEMAASGAAPRDIVEQRGMKQVSDTGEIEAVVDSILVQFPDKVAQYREGKTGLIGFFVGQAMKATAGQGNPRLLNEVFARKLTECGEGGTQVLRFGTSLAGCRRRTTGPGTIATAIMGLLV
jgi:aspartyl-tRNA(Asn)/glutamyl-tRNA(Gln) amidotransferase subunit B